MADVYALLRPDASLLYAQRKGGDWAISDKRPDVGPKGRKACVFVIGEDVLGLEAAIPARTDKEAMRAAPYAVEDELAEPIDEVHVALSGKTSDEDAARQILIVSRERMEQWTETLTEQGLPAAQLVAAHSVLPGPGLLLEAGAFVLGRIDSRSFTLERSLGADVLSGMINGHDTIELLGEGLANEIRRPATGEAVVSEADLLMRLAGWADGQSPVDLRQAAFAPRGSVELGSLSQWRASAVLLGGLAVLWLASVFLETQALNHRTDQLQVRTEEFVQSGWPEATGNAAQVVRDARRQSQSGGASVSVLTLSAILYEAIEAVPASELRSLQFDHDRGSLRVTLAFSGFNDVDQLASFIEARGLTVQRGDARQSGEKVLGDLTMRASE